MTTCTHDQCGCIIFLEELIEAASQMIVNGNCVNCGHSVNKHPRRPAGKSIVSSIFWMSSNLFFSNWYSQWWKCWWVTFILYLEVDLFCLFSQLYHRDFFFLSSNLTLGNKEWIIVWTIIRLKELEWRVHLSRKSTRRCSSTRTSWPHLCCPRDSLRWEQTCPKLLWFTAVECAWFLLTKLTAFTASCATRRTLRATSVIPAPRPCASVASRWLFGTACLRTPLMCPLSTSAPIVAPRSPASLRCPSSRSKWWILKWASFVFSWVNYSSSRFTFSLLVGLIDV